MPRARHRGGREPASAAGFTRASVETTSSGTDEADGSAGSIDALKQAVRSVGAGRLEAMAK